MDSLMRERDVVIAVAADAQDFAREGERRAIGTLTDVDPRLVAWTCPRIIRQHLPLAHLCAAAHNAADPKKRRKDRQGARKTEAHHDNRRALVGLSHHHTRPVGCVHNALMHRLHTELHRGGRWRILGRVSEGRRRKHHEAGRNLPSAPCSWSLGHPRACHHVLCRITTLPCAGMSAGTWLLWGLEAQDCGYVRCCVAPAARVGPQVLRPARVTPPELRPFWTWSAPLASPCPFSP